MNKNLGFSLIEVLISISIIIIFSGMGMVYYNNFTEQKKLDQETKRFTDTLELAKVKSSSGDTSLCQGVETTPMIKKYSVDVNTTSYKLAPECLTGTPVPLNYEVPNNIQIGVTGAPQRISFDPQMIQIAPICLFFKNISLNKCTYVNVEKTGIISDGVCSTCTGCVCPTPIQGQP